MAGNRGMADAAIGVCMSNQSELVEAFWEAYLASTDQGGDARAPDDSQGMPEAWGFGDSAEMADELGQLVAAGVKTATCSLLWEYEGEGEALPETGDLSIILDGAGRPICLIETIEVRIQAYYEVDSQFAYEEGEGDRSLDYWRQAHWRFFGRVCAALGRRPSLAMPLVCERFRVIYRSG